MPVEVTGNTETQQADDKSSLTTDFNTMLAEKTGGKFKSVEELTALEQSKFSNELVEKINEFSKKFNDPQTALDLFLKNQTTDYSKMEPEEAIKTKIKIDNPEFTEKEVDYEFRTKYKQDADIYGEDEVEIGRTKMERDAKKAQEDLIKMQQELALKGDIDQEAIAKQEEQYKQIKQEWDNKTEQAVSQLEKMEIKISETEKLDWKFTDEDKKDAAEIVKATGADSAAFFKMFENEKGEYDHGKMASAYLKLKKFDAIIGAAVEQAANTARQESIKNLKNTDFEPAKNPSEKQVLSMDEQVAQQMSKYI
jgi:hypothetical protein